MTEFPSVEADQLVTKQFLRAELAELRGELRAEMGELRSELRGDMGVLHARVERQLHQQTLWLGGGLAAATTLVIAAIPLLG